MRTILLSLIAFTFSYAAEAPVNSTLASDVDMSSYKDLPKQESRIQFDVNNSTDDGIYNFKYSPLSNTPQMKKNIFLSGNFDAIFRYDSLYFNEESLELNSQESFDEIKEKIHDLLDEKTHEIVVSIIAYTQKVNNKNQDIELDTGYTNFFQSTAQRDNENIKAASEEAVDFMEIIYNEMIDDNIPKELVYKESRIGKGNLYTEEFSEGRSKNNRVDISIYVKELVDPDSDQDGVHDSKDYCPNTPLGSHVDVNGCPYVMSLDLKFDFDKATVSDKKTLENIQELSDFMQKYPVYHANIVGHTDSIGDAKYNKKLSLKRAELIQNMLIKDGIEEKRLSFDGRGESEPLFENINPFNRHQNRRTEVELTLPKHIDKEERLVPRKRGERE